MGVGPNVTTPPPILRLYPASERSEQRVDGMLGRFSFPFAGNFDLTRYAHGALLVHNDDVIDPGSGVDPHRHSEMEIVTWVVEGEVHHTDTAGHTAPLTAGMMQRMSAGTGILHSELNPSDTNPARVVQMWVPPDTPRLRPAYAQRHLGDELDEAARAGRVVTALSGREGEEPGLGIANHWVALDIARVLPGREVSFAAAPHTHLFVTRGSLEVRADDVEPSVEAGEGDAVRGSWTGALTARSTNDEVTEVLVWRMHANF